MSTAALALPAPAQVLDAEALRADAERCTNEQLLDETLALYHPDALVEWIFDGASERHEGIDAIRKAMTIQMGVWRALRLHGQKTVECADENTVALSWRGGFGGRQNQFATEFFTLADGKVVRHQMYCYMDVRPVFSPLAMLRSTLLTPRAALTYMRELIVVSVSGLLRNTSR